MTSWSSVRGRMARVTRLDGCCRPPAPAAPCSVVVTKGIITVQYSPEVDEGEEVAVRDMTGDLCATDEPCPVLKWINVQITFCKVNPDLFGFMTDYPIVLDYKGDSVGNRVTGKISCDTSFSLEMWTKIPQAQCAPGEGQQFGYFITPCVSAGVIGEFTIQNGELTMQINAKARMGAGWGRGPYAVDAQDALQTPGPLLTPFAEDEAMDFHLTTIAPPAETDGCVPMPQYDLSDLELAS